MAGWLNERGYEESLVNEQIDRVRRLDRETLLATTGRGPNLGRNDRIPLVITYNPVLISVGKTLRDLHPMLSNSEEPKICKYVHIIKNIPKTKYLGVIIDQHLNWKQQVDAVYKSYCTKLKLLTRLSYLPKQTLEEIYFKTIIPSVVYCIAVWGSSAESGLQKLEKVHARAARIINQLPKEHDTDNILEKARWLPLTYIYKKRIITIMHDCFYGHYDHRITEMLSVNQRKRIGKENNHQIIRPKKEIGRNCLRFRGPAIWIAVADDIKNIKNKDTFIEKLKSIKDTIITTSFKKGATFNNNKDIRYSYF